MSRFWATSAGSNIIISSLFYTNIIYSCSGIVTSVVGLGSITLIGYNVWSVKRKISQDLVAFKNEYDKDRMADAKDRIAYKTEIKDSFAMSLSAHENKKGSTHCIQNGFKTIMTDHVGVTTTEEQNSNMQTSKENFVAIKKHLFAVKDHLSVIQQKLAVMEQLPNDNIDKHRDSSK
jgi:hypothetical protein